MAMWKRALCAALSACLLLGMGGCGARYQKYRSEFMGLFDTATVFVGYAESEKAFDRYADVLYARMAELDRLYDIYNAYEGLNNLHTVNQNAGVAPVAVDRAVIDLLLAARDGYSRTGGAVNVAMGSVLSIWHEYRTAGIADEDAAKLPPMADLTAAARLTDMDGLIIDEANGTAFLREKGMSLDVGSCAKAYAAGLAAQAMRDAGLVSGLLSAGGNIISIGKPLDNARDRWGVGIQDPDLAPDGVQNILDTIYVNDMTISCSGSYQRFYTVGGENYSHIIDPATLLPAKRYKQVTVAHGDAGLADLLSTALFILPIEEGRALAAENGAEALWIDNDGKWTATDGYIKISKTLGNYSAVD